MAQTPETKEYDNARGNLLASPGGHRADHPIEWIDHDGERHSLCAHQVAPALILEMPADSTTDAAGGPWVTTRNSRGPAPDLPERTTGTPYSIDTAM